MHCSTLKVILTDRVEFLQGPKYTTLWLWSELDTGLLNPEYRTYHLGHIISQWQKKSQQHNK